MAQKLITEGRLKDTANEMMKQFTWTRVMGKEKVNGFSRNLGNKINLL